jgi:hypothetical protein
MQRLLAMLAFTFAALGTAPACTSDSSGPTESQQPVADAGRDGKGGSVDPYNADCESARWTDVSEECWNCGCSLCKDTLNACDETCMEALNCSLERHTLVNVAADLGCEIRATLTECLNTPERIAIAQPLTQFDGCLMAAPSKPAGQFRACEKECGIPYSGDVCQRYPPNPPPPTDGG